jgi:hypothetical protein
MSLHEMRPTGGFFPLPVDIAPQALRVMPAFGAKRSSLASARRPDDIDLRAAAVMLERPEMSDDARWLRDLEHARIPSDIDAASYAVLSKLHALLSAQDLSRCDKILAAAAVNRLPIQVLLALLAGTFRARRHLPGRSAFYAQVEDHLRKVEPTRAESLLRGLR